MAQGHTAGVWFVLDSDLTVFLDKQPTPPSTWQPGPLVPKVANLSIGVRAAGPMASSFLKVENGGASASLDVASPSSSFARHIPESPVSFNHLS